MTNDHEQEQFDQEEFDPTPPGELIVPDNARAALETIVTREGLDPEHLPASYIMFDLDKNALSKAVEIASKGGRVVLASLQSPDMLCDEPLWQAAMAYENVTHFDTVAEGKEVANAIKAAAELPIGLKDRLAVDLLQIEAEVDQINHLEHEYSHAIREGGNRLEKWITQTQALFGEGTPEELYSRVSAAKKEKKAATVAPFAGKEYDDVFVDVEGTLVDETGNVRPSVIAQVEKLAKNLELDENRPVSIWTGGDPDRYRRALRQAGLTWKIVDKSSMQGTTVDFAVDDLSAEELFDKYGVTVKNHLSPEIEAA